MFDFLAVDWGEKNVGLALGDSKTKLVIPYQKNTLNSEIIAEIKKALTDKKIKNIVIGYPTNFAGNSTLITQKIQDFKKTLEQDLKSTKITFVNERQTTVLAKQNFGKYFSKNSNKLKQSFKQNRDNLSAVEILQRYFEEDL